MAKTKFKKMMVYLAMLFLSLQSVFSLSDPINQSLTEFTNLTRADNVLEVVQEMNLWVGGLFGIGILLIIFVVSFVMTLYFRNDMPKALMFTLFITTISSIFLYIANLVPSIAIVFTAPLFLLSMLFAVVQK